MAILSSALRLKILLTSLVNVIQAGGKGNNILTGGLGADKFKCGKGTNTITDFNAAEGDKKGKKCN
jgi:Ca2+-binding RTX toxin-like protein